MGNENDQGGQTFLSVCFVALSFCCSCSKTSVTKVEGDKKLQWADKKATELVAGPHKVSIPPGWRDLSELKNADAPKLEPGSTGMTPEKLSEGGMQTNIVLTWTQLPPGTLPSCDELSQALAKQYNATISNLEKLTVETDQACGWRATNNDATITLLVRFQGDHELVAQWTRMKTLGNEKASSDTKVWAQTRSALHFPIEAASTP